MELMFNRFKEFFVIFLITLILIILSITPAFIKIPSAQTWLISIIICRIILVFLILVIPLIILVRFFVIKHKNSGLQMKHILFVVPMILLLSSIGIFTYGILICYKVIKLEQAYNTAWIKSLAAVNSDDFESKYSELQQIIDLRKKFTDEYLVNNKVLDLAMPILRFCFSGSFKEKNSNFYAKERQIEIPAGWEKITLEEALKGTPPQQ